MRDFSKLPVEIGSKWKRNVDGKIFIISADKYGKGARSVELEPELTGEILWLDDFLVLHYFTEVLDQQEETRSSESISSKSTVCPASSCVQSDKNCTFPSLTNE